jgi:hypothetical protein
MIVLKLEVLDLRKSTRSIFVDLVIVAGVVKHPKNWTNAYQGNKNAEPSLK